jgi:uncharacterized protein (DUF2147 family)
MIGRHLATVAYVALLLVSGPSLRAQTGSGDAILGEWLTAEGKAKILLYKCGEAVCGKINWLKEPMKDGKVVVDNKNPDSTFHSRPVLGLEILRGFQFDGEDEWTGGKIYDPESGDTYSAKMVLEEDGRLKLRGYVLIPLLGRSEYWTR